MYFNYPWGGLLEELSGMEDFDTLLETREDLVSLQDKLKVLDETKTIEEVKTAVASFSSTDVAYLSSKLLCQLADVIQKSYYLVEASEKGYLECIKFLFDREVPNVQISLSLALASRNGHIEVVKLLLPYLTFDDSYIFDAVKEAFANKRFNIFKLLYSNKAYPWMRGYLEQAYKNGYTELIPFLIEQELKNEYFSAEIVKSFCKDKRYDLIQVLLNSDTFMQRLLANESSQKELIDVAIKNHDIQLVQIFINAGLDITKCIEQYLFESIASNDLESIDFILDNYINYVRRADSRFFLSSARCNKNYGILKRLLDLNILNINMLNTLF